MHLLLPTIVSTPLLKVPILLGYATFAYYGMSPPASGAALLPKERRPTGPDFLLLVPSVQKAVTAAAKTVLCSLAVAEALTLLAQHAPQTSFFHRAVGDLFSLLNVNMASLQLRLTSPSVAGCLLGIAGGLIRTWCHRTLGRFFTWEMGLREDHRLVTAGPYSIVRHPSYAGWLLIVSGSALLLLPGSGTFFAETGMVDSVPGRLVACGIMAYLTWVTAGLLYRTKTEDAMLREEFRDEWKEWVKKTPYRVIPFVY
ncbi:ICMT-domain-containing protein [Daedaleopsis nitida]|nr:ICMT-domain-containing protein [Daedaleopsis nitida]